jgi:hypothetical protein
MTTEDLELLKSELPPKWVKILSQRTGRSKSTIQKVMNLQWEDLAIIDAAIILAKETRFKKQEQLQEISNLKRSTYGFPMVETR